MFLRPDEEPELALRLGLVSAQAPVGLRTVATAATTVVSGRPVSAADRLAASTAHARWPRAASPAPRRSRPGCRSSTAATRPAPTASSRSARAGAQPPIRRHHRRGARDRRGRLPRADAARPERQQLRPRPAGGGSASATSHRTIGRTQARPASRPDLAELLRSIDGIRGPDGRPAISRLRFITSHPWDLSDRLIDAMAECPSVCEHLHLPIQSGDDEMLQRMGRQYTVAHYRERLARIREAVPGDRVSTDVIVGFCGETESSSRRPWPSSRRCGSTPSSPRPTRRGPERRRCAWPTTCRRP
jgi:hypothetical protein